jgi:hypothetical protein
MRRRQTPICPECGSVRTRTCKQGRACLEDDCGHFGPAADFKPTVGRPESISAPYEARRPGFKMSLDGIDGTASDR